jgi:hypothetical protein
MATRELYDFDVPALCDRAWDVVDPGAEHAEEERIWTILLRPGEDSLTSSEELRARLDHLVRTETPRPMAIPPRVVAAVMLFVAEHPERRDAGEALLRDALRAAYGLQPPPDVTGWLRVRGRFPAARRRRHGAAIGRRGGARPLVPDADEL